MIHPWSFGTSSAFQLFRETTESGEKTTVQRVSGFVESDFAKETNEAFENFAYQHDEEQKQGNALQQENGISNPADGMEGDR